MLGRVVDCLVNIALSTARCNASFRWGKYAIRQPILSTELHTLLAYQGIVVTGVSY